MLLDEKVKVKISAPTVKYYRNLGFNVEVNQIIDIPIIYLNKKSNIKVNIQCDFCSHQKVELYGAYNRYINKSHDNKYRCRKCSFELKKEQLQEQYGVSYFSQLTQVKDKRRKTLSERYDGHYNKLEKFKDKIKNTNLLKYGVDYPMKNEEVKQSQIKTMIENHGVKTSFQNDMIKSKSIITMIDKYGSPYSMQIEKIRDKILSSSNLTKIQKLIGKNENIIEVNYDENYYLVKCEYCSLTYKITPHMFSMRKIQNTIQCTFCNVIDENKSGLETQLSIFISENYSGNIVLNSKSIISPLELDIYIPDLKLAFEFNGLYWHSELYKDRLYHKNKTDICKNKGIQLIHIWEDDWLYKQDIVKSMILNKLGKTSNKIFARKCEIKEITDNKIVREFLEKNHIQGFVGSKYKIGLYYNDELISLMTFGNLRKSLGQKSKEGSYELLRFCNKLNTSVVGGASKLFKYFIRIYNPLNIETYADYSISMGSLYQNLGFKFTHLSQPNYHYIIGDIRVNRFSFRKDRLVKEGYDANKSEFEIMMSRKIYKIYNSGNLKFIFKIIEKPE